MRTVVWIRQLASLEETAAAHTRVQTGWVTQLLQVGKDVFKRNVSLRIETFRKQTADSFVGLVPIWVPRCRCHV